MEYDSVMFDVESLEGVEHTHFQGIRALFGCFEIDYVVNLVLYSFWVRM